MTQSKCDKRAVLTNYQFFLTLFGVAKMKLYTFAQNVLHSGIRAAGLNNNSSLLDINGTVQDLVDVIGPRVGEKSYAEFSTDQKVVSQIRLHHELSNNWVVCAIFLEADEKVSLTNGLPIQFPHAATDGVNPVFVEIANDGSATITDKNGQARFALINELGALKVKRLEKVGVWSQFNGEFFARLKDGRCLKLDADYHSRGNGHLESTLFVLGAEGWARLGSTDVNFAYESYKESKLGTYEYNIRLLCSHLRAAKEMMTLAEMLYPGQIVPMDHPIEQ